MLLGQVPAEIPHAGEEDDDDYEDEGSHSSSETLTCSVPEVQKTSLFILSRVALVSLPWRTSLVLNSFHFCTDCFFQTTNFFPKYNDRKSVV